jgi:hypothetical protein
MSTKLFLIAVSVFVGISQFANAGVMMFVHFGDNPPDVIQQQDLITGYTPNSSGKLTASIYLHLTGGTSIYGYRFSVRFDGGVLTYAGRQQFRPRIEHPSGDPNVPPLVVAFEPIPEVENEFDPVAMKFKQPDPGPEGPSSVTSDIENGLDLYRFNGLINTTDNWNETGYYKLASLSFDVAPNTPLPAGKPLILPGKFDNTPNSLFPDDVLKDTILTEDVDQGGIPIIYAIETFGGSVSGTTVAPLTVPEPSSGLIYVVLVVLSISLRRLFPTSVTSKLFLPR